MSKISNETKRTKKNVFTEYQQITDDRHLTQFASKAFPFNAGPVGVLQFKTKTNIQLKILSGFFSNEYHTANGRAIPPMASLLATPLTYSNYTCARIF